MLLSELKILPTSSELGFRRAVQKFAETHQLSHDEGSNAIVVDTGKDGIWRAWTNDPGFEKFLEYIKQHKSEKHLPRLLSRVREELVEFKSPEKTQLVKFVKIEKLSPLPISTFSDVLDTIGISNEAASNYPNTVQDLAEWITQQKIVGDSDATVDELKNEILKNEEFFGVLLDLLKNQKANDINSSNVMLRGDIPVITDPIS